MPAVADSRQAIEQEAWTLAEKMRPTAGEIDAERCYPAEHLSDLANAGLGGLLIPEEYGGKGGDLTSLALACEAVGWASGSTALCFLMHLCGTAVIAAKANPTQAQAWLGPAASGKLLATLAFSERATGAHLGKLLTGLPLF